MLSYRGKLCGDLTVACLDENEFMVFGSGAAQEMHRRWFESHIDLSLIHISEPTRPY